MAFKDSKLSTGLLVAVLLVAFIMMAGGIALYHLTLVKWWVPVIPAATLAVVTVPLFSRKWKVLTGNESKMLNGVCHVFVTGTLVYFLYLGVNYWWADAKSDKEECGVVMKKFQKTHTRYRRVSRTTRVADGHYYTYHVMLQFESGEQKEMTISLKSYNRIRTGSTRQIHVQNGALGMRVIKQD